MARIPTPVGLDPAGCCGVYLAAKTTPTLYHPLFEPVIDTRSSIKTILAAETSAFPPVFARTDKSGIRTGTARGNRTDSIESSHDHTCDGCLKEHVLHRYSSQPANGCQGGSEILHSKSSGRQADRACRLRGVRRTDPFSHR